jgi:hypothetical protein
MSEPRPLPIAPTEPPPTSAPEASASTTVLDPPETPVAAELNRVQLWLHRTSVFLFVLIGAVAGVLLIILPWTPEWTDNYLLLSYPWLRSVVSNSFFRGVCTGLGVLDIWIGFWEALHYHEQP